MPFQNPLIMLAPASIRRQALFGLSRSGIALISRQLTPALHIDDRDSARQVAYGRWLNKLPKEYDPGDFMKGILVTFPVAECESEALTVSVNSKYQFTANVRIEKVDIWVDYWFF